MDILITGEPLLFICQVGSSWILSEIEPGRECLSGLFNLWFLLRITPIHGNIKPDLNIYQFQGDRER